MREYVNRAIEQQACTAITCDRCEKRIASDDSVALQRVLIATARRLASEAYPGFPFHCASNPVPDFLLVVNG